MKFHIISSNQRRVFPSGGRTDKHDKLNTRFLQFPERTSERERKTI